MASGFFVLLDDIAALMDDMAVMTKIAAKKTAGILGDDLAVNAEKASGFLSDRELPVLWAITKGSLINKAILLPFAFLLSAFAPVTIPIILVLGGVYLAFEAAEKIYEYVVPHAPDAKVEILEEVTQEQFLLLEKEKVRSAIVTDFILSAEIVIIALGTVVDIPLLSQIAVVSAIALLATVGVYGIVALIVRMDEFGYKLIALNEEENSFSDRIGKLLIAALPKIIKTLAFVGTIALITVSGGIFVHNIEFIHHLFPSLPSIIREILAGLGIGILAFAIVFPIKKMWLAKKNAKGS
jgi:predicted DNA repair protein MutK